MNTLNSTSSLDVARALASAGVPIFLAEPATDHAGNWIPTGGHDGMGYWLPKGWQNTVPDPAVLDRWKPGMGVGAVMGHLVDGVDVDPRSGGTLDGITMPRSFGRASTPSGGTHDLVAAMGVRSLNGFMPGVDIKAGVGGTGHGFLWIAPTRKISKATGAVAEYVWTTAPDPVELSLLELVGPDGSERALAAEVEARHGGTPERAPYAGKEFTELSPGWQREATAYVDRRLSEWRARLEQAAGWFEGERDEKGRGWEALARDAAWAVACLVASPWSPLEDGASAFADILPPEMAGDSACAKKWRDDLIAKAVPEAAPWEAALSDFGIVGPTAPSEETLRGGWTPVDLTALLAGDLKPLEPSVLRRSDGLALLYPGRTHSLSGESGSGKSWVAQWATSEVIREGGRALYVDYESSASSVVARLLALGCSAEDLGRLVYVNPSAEPRGEEFEAILSQQFTLAIVDGVTEALAMSGLRGDNLTNSNDAVTAWHRMLPLRIAEETGAAVLQIDHVTKSKDSRGSYAIGGQAKRASITGAAYIVEAKERFGRGRSGSLKVYVSKDREGYILGALNDSEAAQGTLVGIVNVASTAEGREVRMRLDEVVVLSADHQMEVVKHRILEFLGTLPDGHKGATTRTIRDSVTGNKDLITEALATLVRGGHVTRTLSGQSQCHLIGRPYVPEFEDSGSDRPLTGP